MRPIGPAVLIAALLSASSSASTPSEPPLPAWMSGCWQWQQDERWGEECWTAPRGDQMLGSGRTGEAGKVGSWEFMRIERGEQGLSFHASPGGKGWTTFNSANDAGEGVTFVNPDNDYPQRVRYRREGERLHAEIARLDGTDAVSWTFTRTGG